MIAANGSVVRIKIKAVFGLWGEGNCWPWLNRVKLKMTNHDTANKMLQLRAGFEKLENHDRLIFKKLLKLSYIKAENFTYSERYDKWKTEAG